MGGTGASRSPVTSYRTCSWPWRSFSARWRIWNSGCSRRKSGISYVRRILFPERPLLIELRSRADEASAPTRAREPLRELGPLGALDFSFLFPIGGGAWTRFIDGIARVGGGARGVGSYKSASLRFGGQPS